ncbi:MAG: hypothetical protein ACRC2O_06365 [Chitinophagaceae bacterium]
MRREFKYCGFGLKILSEIEFPELMPDEFQVEDITIALGKIITESNPEDSQSLITSSTFKNQFYLDIPDVAQYLSSKGKKIIVEPYQNSNESSIRIFLLSNAMAALLVQRNQILLHASAIIHENELVLFLGESGAGKSSIAAELNKRGYAIFSDDVCVLLPVRKEDKSAMALSSYPMMKLWDDTINALNDDQFKKQHKLRPQASKYGHFFHDSFEKSAYPVKKIFILNPNLDSIEYSAKKISGLEAFELVGKNTYRSQFIMENELQKLHMESISGLIDRSEIQILSRHAKKSNIIEFTNFSELLF